MNEIQLSIKQKDYDGSHNKYFKCITADKNDLEKIFKSNNYSLITWKIDEEKKSNEYNRKRKIENFESASGIVIDIDEGLSINEAQNKLMDEKLNHIIITSKSHQIKKKDSAAQDRYHILVFFCREVTDENEYRKAFNYLKRIFPHMDDSCTDLARFIFASPSSAEYRSWFDGVNLNPDDIPEKDFLNTPIAEEKNIFEFDNEMEVRLGSGKVVKATQITTKQPCYCVRPDHNDNNPSAIISLNKEKDKWVIHCTGCKTTGWSKLTKTVNFFIQSARSFFTQEVIKDHIKKNPLLHIKTLKVEKPKPEFYTVDELKIFFQQEMSDAYRNAFLGLLLTGMRFGELANLTWKDVDF